MRARRLFLAMVCAVLVVAALPAVAGAAFSNYKSTSADAWWSSWDWEDGEPVGDVPMMDKSVSGWKASGVWKDGKVSTEVFKETNGAVWFYSYTPAVGDQPRRWESFSCFSLDPAFVVGKRLSSAHLDYIAPAEMLVWEGEEPWYEDGEDWTVRDPDQTVDLGMVSVMANWKPSGGLTRSMWINRERSDGFNLSSRDQNMYRDATAQVSVVGHDGTVYWSDTAGGSIYDSKGVGRYPW
jgi:hypothetical protein